GLRIGRERIAAAVIRIPEGRRDVLPTVDLKGEIAPILPLRVPREGAASTADGGPDAPGNHQREEEDDQRGQDVTLPAIPTLADEAPHLVFLTRNPRRHGIERPGRA